MHTDITAFTIQSNKTVSNEVKDNQVLLEPSYGKNRMSILANPILLLFTCYNFSNTYSKFTLVKIEIRFKENHVAFIFEGYPTVVTGPVDYPFMQ